MNSGIAFRVLDPATREPTGERLSDCADDLAYALRSGGFVDGQREAQVFTHTIGFDVAAATRAEGMADGPSRDLLQPVARAGGGRYHAFDCDRCTPAQATDALARLLIRTESQPVAPPIYGDLDGPVLPVQKVDQVNPVGFRPAGVAT